MFMGDTRTGVPLDPNLCPPCCMCDGCGYGSSLCCVHTYVFDFFPYLLIRSPLNISWMLEEEELEVCTLILYIAAWRQEMCLGILLMTRVWPSGLIKASLSKGSETLGETPRCLLPVSEWFFPAVLTEDGVEKEPFLSAFCSRSCSEFFLSKQDGVALRFHPPPWKRAIRLSQNDSWPVKP